MATTTPVLGLLKPVVGADDDLWGGFLNHNMDVLDAEVVTRGSGVAIVGTSPSSTVYEPLWWDSNSGQLFVQYDDGTSVQWVAANSIDASTLEGSFLPLRGGTVTGPLSLPGNADVRSFGALCNGTTDDTAAVNAAISSVASTGGGTVRFPRGTTLMLGAMVLPYTGTNNPIQPPIRLTGAGGSPDSYLGNSVVGPSTPPTGGTLLDMRYSGGGSAVAKIDTRGAGILEIDHLTILDGTAHASYSHTLFIQTTNTTLLIHDCRFRGDPASGGTACLQDCIRLGAIVAGGALGTNGATAGFQGYGTKIENNSFDYIREAVQFGSAANSVFLANNIITHNCGSALPQGGAFHFYGVDYGANGNTIYGGVIEVAYYPYGVVSTTVGGAVNKQNIFDSIGLYDENMSAPSLGGFWFDANSVYNTIYVGFADQPLQANFVQGPGAQSNTIINGLGATRFSLPVTVGTDTNDTTMNIDGSNASGGGSMLAFHNGGTPVAFLGNYSRFYGGAYNPMFVLYAGGHDVIMPTDRLAIATGASGFPTHTLDVGDGTANKIIAIHGGNTGSGDGAQLQFFNGTGLTATIGNWSAIEGGAYDNRFVIYNAGHGIVFPSDTLSLPVAGTLNIGSGTGSPGIIINAASSGANAGPVLSLQWGGVTRGCLSGYSAFFGGTFDNRTVLSGNDGLVFSVASQTNTMVLTATGMGFNRTAPIAKPTGYTAPTGTATRATFATASVTLPVLAEHVKALIDDLTAYGLIGA